MPERKNQHFVPQFYFRQFTDDERIRLHNIEGSITTSEPIKNVCSRDYFYSKNTDIEEAFGKCEGKWADIIREVSEDETLSNLSDEDYLFFRWFLLFQELRTRKKMEEFQEVVDDLAASVYEGFSPPDLPGDKSIGEMFKQGEVKIENHNMQLRSLYKSLSRIIMFNDLKHVFIRNSTEEDFIFSDHPVFFHNYAYCSIDHRGICGYQSRGMQVFCPLSPEIAVIFYDRVTYRVRRDEGNIVEASLEDVKNLNRLQALKADNNLFLTDDFDEEKAEKYLAEMSEYREKEGFTINKHPSTHKGRRSELIHFYRNIADFEPQFSFMLSLDKFPFYAPRSNDLIEKSRQLDEWVEGDLIDVDAQDL